MRVKFCHNPNVTNDKLWEKSQPVIHQSSEDCLWTVRCPPGEIPNRYPFLYQWVYQPRRGTQTNWTILETNCMFLLQLSGLWVIVVYHSSWPLHCKSGSVYLTTTANKLNSNQVYTVEDRVERGLPTNLSSQNEAWYKIATAIICHPSGLVQNRQSKCGLLVGFDSPAIVTVQNETLDWIGYLPVPSNANWKSR